MSVKESALSAITSIAQADFVRVVTAAGASRRISLANLGNAIFNNRSGRFTNVSLTSGAAVIQAPTVTAYSPIVCSIERTGETAYGLLIYPQPTNGAFAVYVRKTDGSIPADGTTITINATW